MGQKVNPHGLRVGVINDWDSRWYARDEKVGDLIVEDYNIRKYLKKLLYSAGIPKIEIERDSAGRVKVFLHCARSGVVIGRGGENIEKLRLDLEKKFNRPVLLSIVEVKNVDTNAQLVAESIALALEKRVSFRRAMKQAMGKATKMGAKGIKTAVSGRLGGAEIARTEHYHEGTIPLQTIRADIDYGFAESNTTYGKIGVKVWIYKGEVLTNGPRAQKAAEALREQQASKERRSFDRRRDNRDRDNRGDRKPGGFNRDNRGGFNNNNRSGGFNNNRPGGGFNNNRPGGGFNNNRPAPANRAPGAPVNRAPAAPAASAPAPKEGGEK